MNGVRADMQFRGNLFVGEAKVDLLKMDIEGAELSVLKTIV